MLIILTYKMFLTSLPADLHNLISKNLCYVDIVSLRWTCKILSLVSLPSFKQIFVNKLFPLMGLNPNLTIKDVCLKDSEYLEVADYLGEGRQDIEENIEKIMEKIRYEFCEMMFKTGSLISGSFILDCLYNTDHSNNINLYTHPKPINARNIHHYVQGLSSIDFIDYLVDCGFQRDKSRYFKLTNDLCMLQVTTLQFYGLFRSKLTAGYTRTPINKFIDATYDLDICKSYFDGENLYVKSWHKLVYRRDYIITSIRLNDAHFGISRFEINNEITQARMRKYKTRGFDIIPHPQDDEIIKYLIELKYWNERCSNLCGAIEYGHIDMNQFYIE
jgi:hypothetical protein